MDAKSKMTIWVVGLICLLVLSMVAIVSYTDRSNKKLFVENGYEQVMLPGETSSKWQKVRCPETGTKRDEGERGSDTDG